MDRIPAEILIEIFKYVFDSADFRSVKAVMLTCHAFKDCIFTMKPYIASMFIMYNRYPHFTSNIADAKQACNINFRRLSDMMEDMEMRVPVIETYRKCSNPFLDMNLLPVRKHRLRPRQLEVIAMLCDYNDLTIAAHLYGYFNTYAMFIVDDMGIVFYAVHEVSYDQIRHLIDVAIYNNKRGDPIWRMMGVSLVMFIHAVDKVMARRGIDVYPDLIGENPHLGTLLGMLNSCNMHAYRMMPQFRDLDSFNDYTEILIWSKNMLLDRLGMDGTVIALDPL